MILLRQASISVANRGTWETSDWNTPPAYPATWETVEDEELPLLDSRLAARIRGSEAALGIERLDAMTRERLRHRTVSYSTSATALIREGVDPNPASWQDADCVGTAPEGTGPWAKVRRIAKTASASLGREGRIRRARDEILLHTLALESLRLLSTCIGRRQLARENVSTVFEKAAQSQRCEAEALLENPAVAALCAAFSGFNTAYLFPQHSFQAELLTAAAWLGWRIEGRSAPLPAAAAEYLAGLEPAVAAKKADPNDPQTVIQFALGVSGINLNKLGKYASEQWPSPRPLVSIRSYRGVNAVVCRRFLEKVRLP
jgi:hypothetical protein